ncbi:MAG TPA: sugar kinase [Stellaceae bacterium]|jgi:2-dehydro-3-deoxygluconokinase|nr:sugar kinase [Stellaceae bacterium]
MSDALPHYDFLTLGETLLRLSPPGMQRLDQSRLFDVGIGGSELNVASVLARLGRRVAWVSRLPEGPLGRIVDGEARRHGVDTQFVRWIAGARLGLMFFEPGPAPRNTRVIYDRKHSAAAEMGFEDAPWEALIAASKRVHLSGITPALGASCRALVAHVAQLGATAGKAVSYDLNYRATLQDTADARAMLATVAPHLELFVVAERDARDVLGFAEEAERLAEAIAARYGMPLVALTRPPGLEPGDLLWARGNVHYAPRYSVEIVDRIGAGDSFVAGLIHGLLDGDLDFAVRFASYAAAIALATPGDINYFAPEDLAAFHADVTGRLVR